MPRVVGAAAVLMAELLQISYADVVLAAPITGGMICPPVEDTASIAADCSFG